MNINWPTWSQGYLKIMTFTFRHPKYWREMRKLQAASSKHQAPSELSSKLQASSPKQQASSSKPQATSSLIREPRNIWKRFEVLGPRASAKIKLLLGCCTCHAIWCGENFNFLPFVTFNSTVKNVPDLLYPNRSGMPGRLRFSILFHIICGVHALSFLYNLTSGPTSF